MEEAIKQAICVSYVFVYLSVSMYCMCSVLLYVSVLFLFLYVVLRVPLENEMLHLKGLSSQ